MLHLPCLNAFALENWKYLLDVVLSEKLFLKWLSSIILVFASDFVFKC